MRTIVSLLALSLACAACDPPVPTAASPSSASPSAMPEPPAPPASHAASADPARPAGAAASESPTATAAPEGPKGPPPSDEELKSLSGSTNTFALELYGKVRASKGSLALSPLSISTALAMTWTGARGETAAQMKKVLHLKGAPDQALDVAGKLVASLRDPEQKITLRVANRLFGDKAYTFVQSYLDQTKAAFGAPLDPVDFQHATDESRRHINDWIAKETQDRIKDLIPSGGITSDTRLVLTNAIYFLGDWMTPFKKESTAPAAFHVTKTEEKSVPTMNQVAKFKFASTGGVKILEMPYQGGELAMMLVLPDAGDGLEAVEKRLSQATVDGWASALRSEQVIVALPKFEINPPEALSLSDTLIALGMPLAFDRSKADFTGMANPPSPADHLYVSKVFHKAFVKLDEKGTEAAAASAVVMTRKGVAMPSSPPVEFRADHPFLFFLRDTRSGLILFMGRVSDPAPK